MPVKKFRPYTPTRRFTTVADFSEITKDKPERSLLKPIKKTGGRNNQGRTTSRFRGGGHKRRYRLIDFRRRDKAGIPAKVNAAFLRRHPGHARHGISAEPRHDHDLFQGTSNSAPNSTTCRSVNSSNGVSILGDSPRSQSQDWSASIVCSVACATA